MRISDWSSDVCSSDLLVVERLGAVRDREVPERAVVGQLAQVFAAGRPHVYGGCHHALGRPVDLVDRPAHPLGRSGDRKSVVQGKGVSVRVDLGGRGFLTKKQKYTSDNCTSTNK